MNTEQTDKKIQYILDENGGLVEMPKEDATPVEYPINYKLKNAFEVFVRVANTENYWISNYGRCVNNLDKKNFYLHKEGKCHYTLFEIDRDGSRWKVETSPAELVAKTFLVRYEKRRKIWHKDGDETNNWYKNLIYVNQQDYKDLRAGKITLDSLDIEQEYIEYKNKATDRAYWAYKGMKERCSYSKNKNKLHKCYEGTTMCKEWLDNPRKFIRWYFEHYYEVEGESMAVDKDLFGDGSKRYSPETCCILPQGLNTLLTNCKKHYQEGQTPANTLPCGVKYNGKTNQYYSVIGFSMLNKQITLSEWDTPEEAFAEYKMMKQADILLVIATYKGKIPDYIYNALLKVEVKPY